MDLSEQIKMLLDPRLTLLNIQGLQVILLVEEQMPTAKRGKLLLDTEKQLRKVLNQRLEVLLEPRGDLNKLRLQLRGVELDGSRDKIFAERYETPKQNGAERMQDNG